MITLTQHSDEQRNWVSIPVSITVHGIALLVLLSLPVSVTRSFVQSSSSATKILLPGTDTPLPPPQPKPIEQPQSARTFAPPQLIERPVNKERIDVPTPKLVKSEPVIVETPRLQTIAPQVAIPPPIAKAPVRTGVLTEMTTEPIKQPPRKEVQLGGFGVPIETRAHSAAVPKMPSPAEGAFDLAPGPREKSVPKSEPRLVASSGFGSTVAQDRPNEQRVIRSGSFGETTVSENTQTAKREVRSSAFDEVAPATQIAKPAMKQPLAKPVEILYKPKPIYTDEARVAGVQGEVWLKMEFGANGTLKVLGIMRHLGHGLDEAALRAAQQIRFNPATQDGASVDSTATVRIVFLLAE